MARNRQRSKQRKRRRHEDDAAKDSTEETSEDEVEGAVDPTDGAPDEELGSPQAIVPDDAGGDDGDDGPDRPVAEEPEDEPDEDESDEQPFVDDDTEFAGEDSELEAEAADARVPATVGASSEVSTDRKAGVFKRFGAFLKASWAELQRVQWPDRRQVGQATAVVLGFVLIAGAYLGLADEVAGRIVDEII